VIALYQHDLTGRPLAQTLKPSDSPFAHALARAACERAPELDELIDRHAHGWSVQRIQPLERSIMRVALLEMLHPDAVPGEEPKKALPPEIQQVMDAVVAGAESCGISGITQVVHHLNELAIA